MRVLLTIIILLSISFATQAQDVKVITFGDSENTNSTYKRHIIKTSPTAFIFGRIPIEFERELTDFMSIQIGFGFTFSSALTNWQQQVGEEFFDGFDYCNSTSWDNDICDDPYDRTIRTGKVGNIISISPRFWFDSDGIDGAYIAPILRYSTYKSNVQLAEGVRNRIIRIDNEFQSESFKGLDYGVHYGYQSLEENITWSYFVGLGVRNETQNIEDLGILNGVVQSGTQEITGKRILVELGLRIGFRI